jgi:hypothetical protein
MCVDDSIHTKGKTTTPYADGVNDIQTRGKMITTTGGLCTENNMITSRQLQYNNPKGGIMNYINWTNGQCL